MNQLELETDWLYMHNSSLQQLQLQFLLLTLLKHMFSTCFLHESMITNASSNLSFQAYLASCSPLCRQHKFTRFWCYYLQQTDFYIFRMLCIYYDI